MRAITDVKYKILLLFVIIVKKEKMRWAALRVLYLDEKYIRIERERSYFKKYRTKEQTKKMDYAESNEFEKHYIYNNVTYSVVAANDVHYKLQNGM